MNMGFMVKVICLSLTVFLFSCATSRKAGWDQRAETVKLSKKELRKEKAMAEKHWKKRHVRADLIKALKHYENIANAVSEKKDYYKVTTRLTRGYYVLADAHGVNKEEKIKYWNIGTAWGEKAMATNEAFRKRVAAGEDVEDAIDSLGKDEIGALYWTAVNLGKWAKAEGIATILKYKSRIKKMVTKVQTADEKFFYGAAHRYWGAYYAVAPSFAGGDVKKSKVHFEKSLKIAPRYLGTKVLFAKFYDTKKGDKASYIKRLKQVLKSKARYKDIEPENIIEKKKAKELLAKVEENF